MWAEKAEQQGMNNIGAKTTKFSLVEDGGIFNGKLYARAPRVSVFLGFHHLQTNYCNVCGKTLEILLVLSVLPFG
jgi:hypothetical protein